MHGFAKLILLMVLLNFIVVCEVNAATINCNVDCNGTCSATSVSNAINSASDGDTISIPAGNCTYSSSVTISKSVSLVGAGSGTSGTVVTTSGTAFTINTGVNNVRISAIRFIASSTSAEPLHVGTTQWSSTGNSDIRIDNSYFTGAGVPIRYHGHCTGVVDHNTFDGTANGGDGINVEGSNADEWTHLAGLGTGDFTFFEDNVFNTNGTYPNQVLSTFQGGRMVVRYNTFNENGTNGQWTGCIDMHGNGHGNDVHGTRAFEIYNNHWTSRTYNGYGRALHIRGGVGVVYNNTFDAGYSWTYLFHLQDYRANSTCSSGAISAPNSSVPWYPYTYCEGGEGYPCWEQPGVDTVNGARISAPIYFWNNTFGPSQIQPQVINCSVTEIQQNRDYYVGTAMPGYAAYTYPHPLVTGTIKVAPSPPTLLP